MLDGGGGGTKNASESVLKGGLIDASMVHGSSSFFGRKKNSPQDLA